VSFDPLNLSAGTLRHVITVQAPSTVAGPLGLDPTAWVTVLTTRASIQSITSKQLFQSGSFTAQVTHQIIIRYPGAGIIQPNQRITSGDNVYVVQAVDNVGERNRVVKILAMELNGVS
jgi:SPP1 family predicted phage head-tail adaptor